jgi:glycosyltransferase involved in cell wall biosynthesis
VRILFVSSQLPYPPESGSRLREFQLLRRIGRHADVELRVVSSAYDEDVANTAALAQIVGGVRVFRAEPIRAGSPSALLNRHRSSAFTAAVGALARGGSFDAVHVGGFSLMRHLPRGCPTPILLAEHSVEHAVWEQRARLCHDPAEHDECLRRARLTRGAARAAWQRAALVIAVSEEDRAAIAECASGVAVRVVPDGADHLLPATTLPTNELETKPTIVFLANFERQPDAGAALRLCREILTQIHRRCPTARLLLVGSSPPGAAHGLPEDAGAVLDAAGIVVCPLPIGGGVNANLRGKPIVTTSAGFEVLGPHGDRAVEVEDDPERFAEAVAALLERQAERKELELRALELARGLPTWDAAADELLACYEVLRGVRSRGAA